MYRMYRYTIPTIDALFTTCFIYAIRGKILPVPLILSGTKMDIDALIFKYRLLCFHLIERHKIGALNRVQSLIIPQSLARRLTPTAASEPVAPKPKYLMQAGNDVAAFALSHDPPVFLEGCSKTEEDVAFRSHIRGEREITGQSQCGNRGRR